ncbi:hypothetical protein BKA65DRAFT_218397 [Rhexocercosporidium sp. MPI-PUGE-AT-0058]|nr:hypothetical protein BKA65DRAFT_218397 [Rhexocercosporidium sp. MPI-PUGE-AT-0058]
MVSSPFLKDGKIATDGDWPEILKKANLEDITSQSTEGANDITVTGDDVWELKFSSGANVTYFKSSFEPEKGSAWVGDEFDSGVLLLAPEQIEKSGSKEHGGVNEPEGRGNSDVKIPVPPVDDVFMRDIPLRADSEDGGDPSIWKIFEISDSNKNLNEFIEVLDLGGSTTVKLLKPAHPTSARNPSALWCMTTPEAYVSIVKLSFLFTLADQPILAWVNEKLGLAIERLDPGIIISATKTVLYSFEDLNPSGASWT